MEINNRNGTLTDTEQHFCIANAHLGAAHLWIRTAENTGETLMKSSKRTKAK